MSKREEHTVFEKEVKEFLEKNLPEHLARKIEFGEPVSREESTLWTSILDKKGWVAPHWPLEFGGTDWNLQKRHIFDVVCRQYHAPPLSGFGFNMVGPAIIKYGTDRQRNYFLPRIRSGELWFCQGYSEPGAGSDLASLKMNAQRNGDSYVLNGSKIWTSGAEEADWIFCLVRTDNESQLQKGISFVLVDLTTDGISIKPLFAFNGKRLWNQVFFDSVVVPIEQRLGEENKGWTVAKSLLGDERLMVSRVAENKRVLGVLRKNIARMQNRSVVLEEAIKKSVTQIEIALLALEHTSLRFLQTADKGSEVGAEVSLLKILGSQLVQRQDELIFQSIDHLAVPVSSNESEEAVPRWANSVAAGTYHHRGYTIAGGSTEIQRNIMAKQILGL